MKLPRLLAAAFAAALVATPALAQIWPPPPPPFVTNPRLNPPPGTPSALPQVNAKQQAGAKQQAKAERRAARAERKMNRHARANACHRQADAEGLSGRERRRFVSRCRRAN